VVFDGDRCGARLTRFMATVEAYPDLKANQNMAQLSSELSETEDQIAAARQTYNDEVLTYNNLREVFPNNLVAGAFSFTGAEFLKLDDEAARKPVKVMFN
jgi:LemA protein